MRRILFVLLSLCITLGVNAQERVLLEIDNEKIPVEEFLYIYNKNNTNADAMSYEAMQEYMDLFINFKLKVHEAEELGLDTMPSFKRELQGYVSSLSQPYLIDKDVEEELIKEIYDRMLYDIKVSHIIVQLMPNYSSEDTLKAYEKIYEVYNKLKKGENFGTLSREYSDDEVSALEDGDLGYKTVYNFVYDFENVMYNTPVGEFSKPFRTQYGYHVLKVTDKRPAKGKYRVAHIMKVFPQESGLSTKNRVKESIYKVYEQLMNGADFAELAKSESIDKKTATLGGDLGWISIGGGMIKPFEETVFNLENIGDISPVLETSYGFHIIKLLDIEQIKPFDEVKGNIKSQIAGTERVAKAKDVVIEELKKEYDLKVHQENLDLLYKLVMDSAFISGGYKENKDVDLSKPILTFKDNNYTIEDILPELSYDYRISYNDILYDKKLTDPEMFVDRKFDKFLEEKLFAYEETMLSEKYPSFKYLINEYHDGILLFELTDKKVWSKAVKDTVGLQKFYEDNKHKYVWDYRYNVNEYKYKDNKTLKALKKALSKDESEDVFMQKLNKKDSTSVFVVKNLINEKGINFEVDEFIKNYNIPEDSKYRKIIIDEENQIAIYIKVIPPQEKSLNDARGIITADYQNFLEKEWIEELHSKYKVVVLDDVLKDISK